MLCIDSMYISPGGDFIFTDANGTYAPVTMWTPGGLCYPVTKAPNFCPEFGSTTYSIASNHCDPASTPMTATDAEGNTINWTATVVSGNGTVALASATGTSNTLTYTPGAGDISGNAQVQVGIGDAANGADCNTVTVMVNFTNQAPTINCGTTPQTDGVNTLYTKTVTASDADACDNLTFSIVSGPGSIDANTGVYTWTPGLGDVGANVITVEVTDGDLSADCAFTVNVLSFLGFQDYIEKTHNTLQGHYQDVNVGFMSATTDLGGFDFMIGYDASALSFVSASLSSDLQDCGWEYFTYRFSTNGNCGGGCPSGYLELIGIAEQNNGPHHPDLGCLGDVENKDIATLRFFVTNDRNFECMYVPIYFWWTACTDNTLSNIVGDSLFMGRNIFNFDAASFLDETLAINYGITVHDNGTFWPGKYGPAVECFDTVYVNHDPSQGVKNYPISFVDFIDGGIDIVCAGDIDARGDINQNGVSNEIADAVMFTNFFIEGITAFGSHPEGAIAASDVNADGLTLSVADLVYLIRVIQGDAQPYPKALPNATLDVSAQLRNGEMNVKYNASTNVGAMLLTFNVNGTAGDATLGAGAADMSVKSGIVDNQLHVLVYNIGEGAIAAGSNDLLSIPVSGSANLVSVEAATYDGIPMNAQTRVLPSATELAQNYPNPFNPTTTISLRLADASEWNLAIYNVAGQLVKTFSGSSDAGIVNVVWDGTDSNNSHVASGIYFYKATVGNFSSTKKMVLMK
jgi:hypothetical protein